MIELVFSELIAKGNKAPQLLALNFLTCHRTSVHVILEEIVQIKWHTWLRVSSFIYGSKIRQRIDKNCARMILWKKCVYSSQK